ncbi:MAG: DUF3192 domain-containing protein [Pseudomonadota bacterium]
MNVLTKTLVVLIITFLASGCIYIDGERVSGEDWRETQRDNREAISELEIGTTRSQIVRELGTPNDSEAFTFNGEEMRVLFYRTQRRHSDGDTTRDETTPLIFKNDVLVGWGQELYADLER